MVDPTDRNSKLVAHSASESARLGKGEVVRIRWYAAAHKAGLRNTNFRWSLSRRRTVFPKELTTSLRDFFFTRVRAFWRVPVSEALDGTL